MATGALKITTKVNLTGLGEEINLGGDEVTMTVPVEYQKGYVITDAYDSESLQISNLASELDLTAMYGLYIKAESGIIYVKCNTAGVVAIDSTDAELTYNKGEDDWLPINPDSNAGIVINGDSATAAFSWMAVASA